MPDSHQRRRGRLFVALAAVAWSTAGLFQRELSVGVGNATRRPRAVRGTRPARLHRHHRARRGCSQAFRAIGRGGLAIVVLLARSSGVIPRRAELRAGRERPLHAGARTGHRGGARDARSASRSRAARGLAMVVALAGVAADGRRPGRRELARPGALAASWRSRSPATLVITRHRRDVSMAPATCLSQVLVFAAAAPFAGSAARSAQRPRAARDARHLPDRARLRLPDDRRQADSGRRGRPDHAARDRARTALGLGLPVRATRRRDPRRRRNRPRSPPFAGKKRAVARHGALRLLPWRHGSRSCVREIQLLVPPFR